MHAWLPPEHNCILLSVGKINIVYEKSNARSIVYCWSTYCYHHIQYMRLLHENGQVDNFQVSVMMSPLDSLATFISNIPISWFSRFTSTLQRGRKS